MTHRYIVQHSDVLRTRLSSTYGTADPRTWARTISRETDHTPTPASYKVPGFTANYACLACPCVTWNTIRVHFDSTMVTITRYGRGGGRHARLTCNACTTCVPAPYSAAFRLKILQSTTDTCPCRTTVSLVEVARPYVADFVSAIDLSRAIVRIPPKSKRTVSIYNTISNNYMLALTTIPPMRMRSVFSNGIRFPKP